MMRFRALRPAHDLFRAVGFDFAPLSYPATVKLPIMSEVPSEWSEQK